MRKEVGGSEEEGVCEGESRRKESGKEGRRELQELKRERV